MKAAAGDVVRAALTVSVDALVHEDAALRLHADEEAVHRARVSVRRLRCDLRTFVPVLLPAWADGLRERSRWLQDGFSAARDADVLLARLLRQSAELPAAGRDGLDGVLAPLRAEREAAYERLGTMLHEPRYAALLAELIAAAHDPPFRARAAEPACDVLPAIVAETWSTLRKRVRKRMRPPSDRELHRIRIAAKRLRYAAEAIAPVAGRRAAKLARALERMQTILGDQHDATGACERLDALATSGSALVAGELAVLEQRSALEGRRAWRAAWRKAKRARRRFMR